MMLHQLKIGDKVEFRDEIWVLKEATVDQVDNTKAWVGFDSITNPDWGGIFECWALNTEVTRVA